MKVLTKIEKMKAKMKKNECILLTWDRYGDNDSDEFESCVYVSHSFGKSEDDNGEEHEGMFINVRDSDGQRVEIEEYRFDDIKSILCVKKDFKEKIRQMNMNKRPENRQNHVGIELEFISKLSSEEIKMAMIEAGIEAYITVKDDGSIDTEDKYQYSHELCILAPENKFKNVVRSLCLALRRNSTVNKSCGMHVHLDMRGRNTDACYKSLYEAQPILYAMCPKSRLTGTYSQPEKMYKPFFQASNNVSGGRYVGINRQAYSQHQTLEIRLHSGTLQADKIINWVSLLIKIINSPIENSIFEARLVRNLTEFKKRTKLRGKLSEYVDGRIKEFEKQHGSSEIKLTG